jgi:hypothetical protein
MLYYAIFDLDLQEFRVIECGEFRARRHTGLATGSKAYCQEALIGATCCERCGDPILAETALHPASDCRCI